MATPPGTFRIIHASDPHFGSNFNEEIWQQFCRLAVSTRPHLVLITGDCVNTPWRWALKRAKAAIDTFDTQLNAGRSPDDCCYIRMTPGNHDVRFTGLFPADLGLILRAVTTLVLIVMLLLWSWNLVSFRTALLSTVGAALLVAVGHICCVGRWTRVFNDRMGTTPEQFQAGSISVDVYYFDSASQSIGSAEGFVRPHDFTWAAQQPTQVPPRKADSANPGQLTYRLAITHHHPLGIPHDHQHERLMVLRNAGALLSELTSQHIRLILHGHRHHPYFGRVVVHANQPEAFSIGVLSAGTVSRGKKTPEKYDYQFHVLSLDPHLNMQVTPYVSEGGTFQDKPPFYIEDLHDAIRRQRRFAEKTYGIKASLLKGRTLIYPDGDTLERMEYYGFRVVDPSRRCTQLPRPTHAIVDKGHIERLHTGSLDTHCPPAIFLQPDPKQFTLRQQYGHIQFGSEVYAQSVPFSFFTQFNALNSLAMSLQQHVERYGTQAQPRTEATTLVTPVWPIDRMEMTVEFPMGFEMTGTPELIVENRHNQRLNLIEEEYRQVLTHEKSTNTVRLAISTPPPETSFTVRWGLCHVEPPEARAVASLSGATKQLQRTLLALAWGAVKDGQRAGLNPHTWATFQEIVRQIEVIVRERLHVGSAQHDPLEVSLTIYDPMTGVLRNISGNYPATDDRATLTFEFGDGIIGRCHKSNSMRLFIKALSDTSDTPYGYLPWPNYPLPAGIAHEVLFCLPLTNPQDPTLIYGVLNIGSRRADSRLLTLQELQADTDEQRANRQTFYTLLNIICYTALFGSITGPALTGSSTTDTVTS